jgi:hypothetical protein
LCCWLAVFFAWSLLGSGYYFSFNFFVREDVALSVFVRGQRWKKSKKGNCQDETINNTDSNGSDIGHAQGASRESSGALDLDNQEILEKRTEEDHEVWYTMLLTAL